MGAYDKPCARTGQDSPDGASAGWLTAGGIRIVVSCHKKSPIPSSDLYLPVHAGAADAREPLEGAVPDNQGDNISKRNFTFSEMTCQYWAWKNLDVPYVGQCHYRRFFCFDGRRHEANDHAQIEVDRLDERSIRRYRLDDTALIEATVKAHDLVVPPRWNVVGVPVPGKPAHTVREHMVSYDLFDNADVDELVSLVREMAPEYAADVCAYLDGPWYRGYNCFIMRRALFEELCAFEFPVLLAYDSKKDYTGLTGNRRRICGYFGEILFSAFVEHVLGRTGTDAVDFVEVPLTFFFETDGGALTLRERLVPRDTLRHRLIAKALHRR